MIENPANKMTLKGLVVKVYGHSGLAYGGVLNMYTSRPVVCI